MHSAVGLANPIVTNEGCIDIVSKVSDHSIYPFYIATNHRLAVAGMFLYHFQN